MEVVYLTLPLNFWLTAGAISGFLAVAAGAFGAHGLRPILSTDSLRTYETAVHYQMVHALGLLVIAWVRSTISSNVTTTVAGWGFLIGSVLFSGSLYALALTDIKWLGAITPFGGVAFLLGWAALAWTGLSKR